MPMPADIIADMDARSTRVTTRCGSGDMVWRRFGHGEPLVLLHGGSGSWMHWLKTIPHLERRYEVWAPDLPGLGDSAMPPEPLTPATCGAIVAEGLVQVLGDRRPHIVCFSFGCHVGAFAAAQLGDQVRSLILSGSAALGLPHGKRDFAREHARMTPAERAEVHRSNLHVLMIADAARIDNVAIHIQADNIAKARFRSRPFAASDDVKQALAYIAAPVGAVWGEYDQICSIGGVDARLAAIRERKPDAVTRLVRDAGHWAMYEQPAAFNVALDAVLEALEQR